MKEYQLHGLRALAQSPKGTVPAFLQAPATQGPGGFTTPWRTMGRRLWSG